MQNINFSAGKGGKVDLSVEFWLQLMAYIVTIGVGVGSVKTHINYIIKKIESLEKKQDKYNNMQERMIKVEQSTKSSHHRIDDVFEELRKE